MLEHISLLLMKNNNYLKSIKHNSPLTYKKKKDTKNKHQTNSLHPYFLTQLRDTRLITPLIKKRYPS